MPIADNLSHMPHSNEFYFKPNGDLYIPCFYNWQAFAPNPPPTLRTRFRWRCYFRWYYGRPGITDDDYDPSRSYDATAIAFHRNTAFPRDKAERQVWLDRMEKRGDELMFDNYTDELIIAPTGSFQTGWYFLSIIMYYEGQWQEFSISDSSNDSQDAMSSSNKFQYLFNKRDFEAGSPQGNDRPQIYLPDKLPQNMTDKPDERPRLTLITTVKPTKCKAITKPIKEKNIKFGETAEANVIHVPNGWKFVSWHKDATGQDLSTTITMDKNKEAIALFEQDKVGVNVIVQPSGSGRVIPSEVTEVLHGDILTLMAIPDSGYNFKRWIANDGSTISEQQTYGHKITTSTNITAEFEQVKFSVQFKRHGNGTGRLQIDGEEINESTLALGTTKKYSLNKQISIKAIANDDSRFVAWEDGTTNIERQITVDAQHVVRPLFLKYPKNDLVPVFSFIPHCEVVSV